MRFSIPKEYVTVRTSKDGMALVVTMPTEELRYSMPVDEPHKIVDVGINSVTVTLDTVSRGTQHRVTNL